MKDKINIAVLVSGGGTNLQALIDAVGSVITSGVIKLVISNNRSEANRFRAVVFYSFSSSSTDAETMNFFTDSMIFSHWGLLS